MQQRLGEGGPGHGGQAGLAQAGVGPGVAGAQEAVAAVGFVEGVGFAIGAGGDGAGQAIGGGLEVGADALRQFQIFGGGDWQGRAVRSNGRGVRQVGDVQGGAAQAADGLERGAGARLCPGGGFQIEGAFAPADGDVGGGQRGALRAEQAAPVQPFVVQGHDDVGVQAVAEKVDSDTAFSHRRAGGVQAHAAQRGGGQQIQQRQREEGAGGAKEQAGGARQAAVHGRQAGELARAARLVALGQGSSERGANSGVPNAALRRFD